MKSVDMVILIIDGNYGSPASGEKEDDFNEYISVTRKEFKTAKEEGIPIYCFIDSKVHADYDTYEMNAEDIQKGRKIKFRNVKNDNVFIFIKEIKNVGIISITEFNKANQIKDFLGKQWSDMFKKYLSILRGRAVDEKLENAVDEMKILIKKMDIMLDSVGKKVLISGDDPEEYLETVEKQRISSLNNYISNTFVLENFQIDDDVNIRKQEISKLLDFIVDRLSNAKDANELVPQFFSGELVVTKMKYDESAFAAMKELLKPNTK